MILIADGGSTKVDWILLNNGELIQEIRSSGLNPSVLDTENLKSKLENLTEFDSYKDKVIQVYFYGAGCGSVLARERLQGVLQSFFSKATVVEVQEDTYAAVYATTAGEPCIVSIIGTGSNSCYYDGEKIHDISTSLGYTIMDEASGNYFGKQLLQDYFYNRMPENIKNKFEHEFNLDVDFIKENLYRKERPNRYLATFAKFIRPFKHEDYMITMLKKGFDLFFENKILTHPKHDELPIHFVGSIAHYYNDILLEVATSRSLKIGKIVQRPILGLIEYHKNLIN